MSDTDASQLRSAQAQSAELLAQLLRDHQLPAIGWYISGTDGHIEGQIYRDDAEATHADLQSVAELLGGEVTDLSHGAHESGAWERPGVEAHYQGTPVAVFGYAGHQAD